MTSRRMFRRQGDWLSALPLLLVAAALGVIAIMALAGAQSTDARTREALFDYFQRLAPAAYESSEDFQLVLIDRESVDRVGPWPWPRTIIADLVEAASEAGAAGVILTQPVDAPDPLSPETIGAFWLEGASDDALARQLARLPRTDEALAGAFSSVAGAVAVSASAPADPNDPADYQRADAGEAPWLRLADSEIDFLALPSARYLYSLDAGLAAAAAPAIAALEPDPDGIIRRVPLLWSLAGAPAPALSLRAAQLAAPQPEAAIAVRTESSGAASQGRTLKAVGVEAPSIPVSSGGAMRLHFPKRIAPPTTSAARLIAGGGSNSQLRGAVVLIGLDAELGPSVETARGEMTPAALHALAAAQIAGGDAPRRPGWSGYLEALAVMVLGAAAIMTAQRFDFWQAIGFAAIIAIALFIGAFIAFAQGGLLIDPLAPSLALFIGALSVAGGRSLGVALRDDSLRGSFHDALPEPVMKRLREEGPGGVLTGVHREITVLACELRILDDDLADMTDAADDATKVLATAALDLRETIVKAGGAADQAEGGRVFAYFNAPGDVADHIQAGCSAALRLVESMDKINTDLDASSRTAGLQVHLAIGVATGPCFAGPMGHGRNNRYSAFGPAVDRAAFLRSQSEYYGPAMICDETVYREAHHQFAFLELDRVRARGAERPFSVYALIGNPFIKSSKAFRDLDEAHRRLLAAYRAGDAKTARVMLEAVRKSPGAKISLFDIYEHRIDALDAKGAPADWDGAHEPSL